MLQQELEFDSKMGVVDGSPVLAGTPVSVAQVLEKLRDGWFIGDIVRTCALDSDGDVLAAVSYAESLPSDHYLAHLLKQYRENLIHKVWTILGELKQALQTLYGERLVQIVLFGSQARGNATPDSDIDVLIVLRGPVHWLTESERISTVVAELSLRYTELLNCTLIDEAAFLHQTEHLLDNIRQEGILV